MDTPGCGDGKFTKKEWLQTIAAAIGENKINYVAVVQKRQNTRIDNTLAKYIKLLGSLMPGMSGSDIIMVFTHCDLTPITPKEMKKKGIYIWESLDMKGSTDKTGKYDLPNKFIAFAKGKTTPLSMR